MKENIYITEDEDGNCFEFSYSERKSYNYLNRFMVSWWGKYSCFNNEQIQIGDIKIMTTAYSSPGSFVSRARSKSI